MSDQGSSRSSSEGGDTRPMPAKEIPDWRSSFTSENNKAMCSVPLWTVEHTYLSLATKHKDDGSTQTRSRKTLRNAPVLAPCESGALAALVGLHRSWGTQDEEEEEDSRDVALALTFAAMLAVPPFHGIHLNSTPCTKDDDPEKPEFCPCRCDLEGDSFSHIFQLPQAMFGAAMVYQTAPMMPGWENLTTNSSPVIAAASVGNLNALAPFADKPDDFLLNCVLIGCLLSDNPTTVQCLIRNPISDKWRKFLEGAFYTSHTAHMISTRFPMSISQRLPDATLDLLMPTHLEDLEEDVQNSTSSESGSGGAGGSGSATPGGFSRETTPLYGMSPDKTTKQHKGQVIKMKSVPQLFCYLASLEKKHLPGLGGTCSWPQWDKCYIYSSIFMRMTHHGTVKIGGVVKNRCDVAAMEVETNPTTCSGWTNLATQMQHGQTVKIDDGLTGPKEYDKVQIASRGCEVAMRTNYDMSLAWNNLAFCMLANRDEIPTATVNGKTYTRYECGKQALDLQLRHPGKRNDPQRCDPQAACVWDTMGSILEKGQVYTEPRSESQRALAQQALGGLMGRTDGDDDHVPKRPPSPPSVPDITYTRIECFLKSLNYNNAYYMGWFHLGFHLSDMQPPVAQLSAQLSDTALSYLCSYGEESEYLLNLALACRTSSGTLTQRQNSQNAGTGGGDEDEDSGSVGTASVSEELCYRIAMAIDEMALLAELANDEPHNLEHFIKAIGEDQISERGKRLLIRKLGFSFDRGSKSYSFSLL